MQFLGISAYYHDSAAALVRDGRVVAAAEEERFSRLKHDPRFPEQAITYCLAAGKVCGHELDGVAYYEKPFRRFERLLETYLHFAPRGWRQFSQAIPSWLSEKLWIKDRIARLVGHEVPIFFLDHHLSHAAAAFYPSPFEEAAILTLDGVGEWCTAAYGVGKGHAIEIEKELHFPHSLGLLYSAFTYYCGFKVNSGEYKLMGLAPYGEPVYVETILKNLVELKEDGSFRLNMEYFDYCTGLTMTNERFHRLFGGPPRRADGEMTRRHMDLARSVQHVTERILLGIARYVRDVTGLRNLCMAGGVALNCVANSRLRDAGVFDRIWVQPAAGDAGAAVGAAFYLHHQRGGQPRCVDDRHDAILGSLLGPEYSKEEMRSALESEGAVFVEYGEEELIERVADHLVAGEVAGWFQGRMEFGPRALGNRSILADPRSPHMQKQLNLKIKFRESFRPFAPAVLEEKVEDWFDLEEASPYMLFVADVATCRVSSGEGSLPSRSEIPAVTHVDGSARVQTVCREINPLFHRLISAFERRTGCPVVVNTSFNVRGEPIVCRPADAIRCFLSTDIDILALGPFLLSKAAQPEHLWAKYPRGHRALD